MVLGCSGLRTGGGARRVRTKALPCGNVRGFGRTIQNFWNNRFAPKAVLPPTGMIKMLHRWRLWCFPAVYLFFAGWRCHDFGHARANRRRCGDRFFGLLWFFLFAIAAYLTFGHLVAPGMRCWPPRRKSTIAEGPGWPSGVPCIMPLVARDLVYYRWRCQVLEFERVEKSIDFRIRYATFCANRSDLVQALAINDKAGA